ncbi:hypothetical protein GJAV_G00262310 [Gymnothorax javanicus]|nr:hypothetical protein GJAV_G00262310 [Gymnothorax javanicus]
MKTSNKLQSQDGQLRQRGTLLLAKQKRRVPSVQQEGNLIFGQNLSPPRVNSLDKSFYWPIPGPRRP